MKTIYLTIALLLVAALPANAIKRIQANPVNLAAMISEKGDSAHIDGYFKYYGYLKQEVDPDGYTVMRHPTNGNELRYTFKDGDRTLKYPTVIVKTNELPKDLDARLKELKYEKSGKTYHNTNIRFGNYLTTCTPGPSSTLIFRTTDR